MDSSKSEKREKSPIRNPIEHKIVQRKALDDQEVRLVKKRHLDDDIDEQEVKVIKKKLLDDDGINKKRALFDMTKKSQPVASSYLEKNVKNTTEILSTEAFDYQRPDLRKKKT